MTYSSSIGRFRKSWTRSSMSIALTSSSTERAKTPPWMYASWISAASAFSPAWPPGLTLNDYKTGAIDE